MKRVLIWGTGHDYELGINWYKYHELKGEIEILGVVSNDKYYSELDGYKFIDKKDIDKAEYDYLIISSREKFAEISEEAAGLGVRYEKILHMNIFKNPNLNLERYVNLKNSNISIISNNCWGGLTYNNLGIKFNSPFINMFIVQKDYLKILKNLDHYLNAELKPDKIESDEKYPIGLLDDVKLHFNHYDTFGEAKLKWEERKKRLNKDNLFIMMFTEDPNIAEEFEKLEYKKKICFVPFETKLASCYKLNKEEYGRDMPFHEVVVLNTGSYKTYDAIELLLTGVCRQTDRIKRR